MSTSFTTKVNTLPIQVEAKHDLTVSLYDVAQGEQTDTDLLIADTKQEYYPNKDNKMQFSSESCTKRENKGQTHT